MRSCILFLLAGVFFFACDSNRKSVEEYEKERIEVMQKCSKEFNEIIKNFKENDFVALEAYNQIKRKYIDIVISDTTPTPYVKNDAVREELIFSSPSNINFSSTLLGEVFMTDESRAVIVYDSITDLIYEVSNYSQKEVDTAYVLRSESNLRAVKRNFNIISEYITSKKYHMVFAFTSYSKPFVSGSSYIPGRTRGKIYIFNTEDEELLLVQGFDIQGNDGEFRAKDKSDIERIVEEGFMKKIQKEIKSLLSDNYTITGELPRFAIDYISLDYSVKYN
jgi:hypothetical protein